MSSGMFRVPWMSEEIKQTKENEVNIKAWDVHHRLTSDGQGTVSHDLHPKFLGPWGCCFHTLCAVTGLGCVQTAETIVSVRHGVEDSRKNTETLAARLALTRKSF